MKTSKSIVRSFSGNELSQILASFINSCFEKVLKGLHLLRIPKNKTEINKNKLKKEKPKLLATLLRKLPVKDSVSWS